MFHDKPRIQGQHIRRQRREVKHLLQLQLREMLLGSERVLVDVSDYPK